jgi:hypothetical protein
VPTVKSETTIGIFLIIIGGIFGASFGWDKSNLGFSGILLMVVGVGISLKIHKRLIIDLGVLTGIIFACIGILLVYSGEYRGVSVSKLTGYLVVLVGTVIAVTIYISNKP